MLKDVEKFAGMFINHSNTKFEEYIGEIERARYNDRR